MAEEYEDEEYEDNINSGKEQKPEKEYKTTEARRRATAKYEKESVRGYTMRVPRREFEKLQEYCKEHHEKDKLHPKYQSLNTLIIASLEKETGVYLRGISKASEDYEMEQAAKKEWIATDPLKIKEKNMQIPTDERLLKLFEDFLQQQLDEMWEMLKDELTKQFQQRQEKLTKTDSQS